jgi:hypothetical protein
MVGRSAADSAGDGVTLNSSVFTGRVSWQLARRRVFLKAGIAAVSSPAPSVAAVAP